jgi:hypothetical protein
MTSADIPPPGAEIFQLFNPELLRIRKDLYHYPGSGYGIPPGCS